MEKIILKAEARKNFGRKIKALRREGTIPANIYGRDVKSVAIQLNLKDFQKVYEEAGETGLVEISLGSEKRPVLIHNVQLEPVTGSVLHVDFLQVNLKQKVTANVPVEITGESPAEKQSLGTVVQYINEIEVDALPTDLPEKFEIDATLLAEVDQTVYVKDLKIAKDVEIKSDPEEIVVKVEALKEEKEELPPAPTESVEGQPVDAEATAENEAKEETTQEKK